jgi:uncharacterized cupredoxin-like copper-binding protein
LTRAIVAAALVLAAASAWSHGDSHGSKPGAESRPISREEHEFGRAGDPRRAARTISIAMHDTMRFAEGDLVVKQGETIRFIVRNHGKVMHEMVIGTRQQLKEHAELMRKFPNMEHDEPYMAHVAPGKQSELVWQFTKRGEFYYACLVPGHMEAGMISKITVR